jgi:hypothetical protein
VMPESLPGPDELVALLAEASSGERCA